MGDAVNEGGVVVVLWCCEYGVVSVVLWCCVEGDGGVVLVVMLWC